MLRKLLSLAVLSAGIVAAPASAQGSIAGTWNTEFDIGIRNENGVETSMGKRQATLTLAVKGDSVIGTWQAAPDAGGAPPPIQLKGIRTGNKMVLQSEPVERTVNVNGDEQRVKMVTTYRLELRADQLVGTSQNTAAEGSFDGPERPFVAKRAADR